MEPFHKINILKTISITVTYKHIQLLYAQSKTKMQKWGEDDQMVPGVISRISRPWEVRWQTMIRKSQQRQKTEENMTPWSQTHERGVLRRHQLLPFGSCWLRFPEAATSADVHHYLHLLHNPRSCQPRRYPRGTVVPIWINVYIYGDLTGTEEKDSSIT